MTAIEFDYPPFMIIRIYNGTNNVDVLTFEDAWKRFIHTKPFRIQVYDGYQDAKWKVNKLNQLIRHDDYRKNNRCKAVPYTQPNYIDMLMEDLDLL